MKDTSTNNYLEEMDAINISTFGYELIRNEVLQDLLGKEANSILYWSGKSLARKYPLYTIEEMIQFFRKAGWGDLTLVKEHKTDYLFALQGELIENRMKTNKDYSFQLEAGFLAEQIQTQVGKLTEAHEQKKQRAKKVLFTVQWDKNDVIE